MPGQRRSNWTNERIERELLQFLSGKEEWPTYREFQRAGKRELRDAITERGGAEHWARQLGLTFKRHPPGYAKRWTEERIRADLRSFLRRRRRWPSRNEFEAAGRKPLRDAIGRTGGPERWAAEFGLARDNLRSGSRRVWTRERVEEELRAFVGGRGVMPTTSEFREAGLAPLLTATYRYGGPRELAHRLGVKPADGGQRRVPPPSSPWARKWTDERISAELGQFCADRDTFPTQREFASAGRLRLYRAASLYGGIERWARQLGFDRIEGRTRFKGTQSEISGRTA
jgi:hypothetical protein